MATLFLTHAWLRWVIVAAGAAALLAAVLGGARRIPPQPTERALHRLYVLLLTVQGGLGLALLLVDGFGGAGFPADRLLHLVVMTAAIGAAHGLRGRAAHPPMAARTRSALGVLVSLILTFVGVMVLR